MPPAAREITLRFPRRADRRRILRQRQRWSRARVDRQSRIRVRCGWASTYSVTAYVGNVRFSRPVKVGDLVEATAKLVHTGRSSMHILVIVRSGNVQDRVLTEATQCLMVFVAMGADGRSTPVAPWQPVTEDDREQQASAQRRMALRADIEAAMAGQQYTDEGTAPSVVPRFLAAPTDVNCGRQGSRWDRDALDRRSSSRPRESMDSQPGQCRRLCRRRPFLPPTADRAPCRGRSPPTPDQSQRHAYQYHVLHAATTTSTGSDDRNHRLRAPRGHHNPSVASDLVRGQGTRGTRLTSHPSESPRRYPPVTCHSLDDVIRRPQPRLRPPHPT